MFSKKIKTGFCATLFCIGLQNVGFADNPFVDVPADHWAYESIAKLEQAGVVEGYGDNTYRGNRLMTRYEMAQIVARAMSKGAKVDKLAAEFKEELDRMGYRVSDLEKKIKFLHQNAKTSKSKIYPALLHDCICCKTRLNLSIHHNIDVRDRAIPDIVITFTMSDKITTMLSQYFSYLFFVFSHSPLPARAFPTKKSSYKKVLFVCSVLIIPESHTLRAQSRHQTIQTPKPSPEHLDW